MAIVRYRLATPEPHTHLVEVEVRIATDGPVELVMPSWTPGSYLLREFARNVQDFAAEADGATVPWHKVDKGTWRVEAGRGELTVRYRVYANELTVRTSHVDHSHAYINGASVFMYVRGRESQPLALTVDAPAGWRTTTSLDPDDAGGYTARDYDELADSPLEIGTHELIEWEQEGIPHRFAIWGRGSYDPERLVADTRRIIAATGAMFGGLPYDRYTFFLHLFPEGRGGLEHLDSCSLQAGRWAFEGEEYENFLALVAHEFFHVWNIKRIRPAALGPFDYTAENYTRSLWVAEGLTTYYTDLVLRRAGIINADRYLTRLSESVARMQALPGRKHQTLEESSFDTWIRFYRPDQHTPNAQISYYHKGALVGLLLDLEIRRSTDNRRSLDDLVRLLWERYGAEDVGFPEQGPGGIEALAEEVAGTSLRDFFDAHLRGTAELDYDRYLAAAGLHLGQESAGTTAEPKRAPDVSEVDARLGLRTRDAAGKLQALHVLEDGPAWVAGINAGDEILAVDGLRVASTAELARRVRGGREGDEVELALFRRDELLTIPVRMGPAAAPKLKIVPVEDATAGQVAVREDWLRAEENAAATA